MNDITLSDELRREADRMGSTYRIDLAHRAAKHIDDLTKAKHIAFIEGFVADLTAERLFLEDFDPALIQRLRKLLAFGDQR